MKRLLIRLMALVLIFSLGTEPLFALGRPDLSFSHRTARSVPQIQQQALMPALAAAAFWGATQYPESITVMVHALRSYASYLDLSWPNMLLGVALLIPAMAVSTNPFIIIDMRNVAPLAIITKAHPTRILGALKVKKWGDAQEFNDTLSEEMDRWVWWRTVEFDQYLNAVRQDPQKRGYSQWLNYLRNLPAASVFIQPTRFPKNIEFLLFQTILDQFVHFYISHRQEFLQRAIISKRILLEDSDIRRYFDRVANELGQWSTKMKLRNPPLEVSSWSEVLMHYFSACFLAHMNPVLPLQSNSQVRAYYPAHRMLEEQFSRVSLAIEEFQRLATSENPIYWAHLFRTLMVRTIPGELLNPSEDLLAQIQSRAREKNEPLDNQELEALIEAYRPRLEFQTRRARLEIVHPKRASGEAGYTFTPIALSLIVALGVGALAFWNHPTLANIAAWAGVFVLMALRAYRLGFGLGAAEARNAAQITHIPGIPPADYSQVWVSALNRYMVIHPEGLPPDNPFTESFLDYITQHPNEFKGKRVLEIGVGAGPLAIALARVGANVTAVDLWEPSLDNTRLNLEQESPEVQDRIRLGRSDVYENLPEIESEISPQYDYIVSDYPLMEGEGHEELPMGWKLIHFAGDEFEVNRRILQGLPQRLKPGGKALVWALQPQRAKTNRAVPLPDPDGIYDFWTRSRLPHALPNGWIATQVSSWRPEKTRFYGLLKTAVALFTVRKIAELPAYKRIYYGLRQVFGGPSMVLRSDTGGIVISRPIFSLRPRLPSSPSDDAGYALFVLVPAIALSLGVAATMAPWIWHGVQAHIGELLLISSLVVFTMTKIQGPEDAFEAAKNRVIKLKRQFDDNLTLANTHFGHFVEFQHKSDRTKYEAAIQNAIQAARDIEGIHNDFGETVSDMSALMRRAIRRAAGGNFSVEQTALFRQIEDWVLPMVIPNSLAEAEAKRELARKSLSNQPEYLSLQTVARHAIDSSNPTTPKQRFRAMLEQQFFLSDGYTLLTPDGRWGMAVASDGRGDYEIASRYAHEVIELMLVSVYPTWMTAMVRSSQHKVTDWVSTGLAILVLARLLNDSLPALLAALPKSRAALFSQMLALSGELEPEVMSQHVLNAEDEWVRSQLNGVPRNPARDPYLIGSGLAGLAYGVAQRLTQNVPETQRAEKHFERVGRFFTAIILAGPAPTLEELIRRGIEAMTARDSGRDLPRKIPPATFLLVVAAGLLAGLGVLHAIPSVGLAAMFIPRSWLKVLFRGLNASKIFRTPDELGLENHPVATLDDQMAQMSRHVQILMREVMGFTPRDFDPDQVGVLNVGSGFHPLVLPKPWPRALNIDYLGKAISISERIKAEHRPWSLDEAILKIDQDPTLNPPNVLLFHDRSGYIIRNPIAFWAAAWSLTLPGGWILFLNPPSSHRFGSTSSLGVWLDQLREAAGSPLGRVYVISPDQTIEHAMAIAIQKPIPKESRPSSFPRRAAQWLRRAA